MTDCPKAGCGAAIGADGYCTRCGTAVRPAFIRPAETARAASAPLSTSSTARLMPSPLTVGGTRRQRLVSLPETADGAQLAPVLVDPQVPERKRFCLNPACRQEVGRSRNGSPGLVEGHCTKCGTKFSFRPLLQPGMLVGGDQFQVKGAIAHGGLGWVYRAWDRRVRHWVVLKGLIDPDDPTNRQAAVAELRALADARHPNIVRVLTVVRHPHPSTKRDVDYIVMECLSGKSLKQLRQERPGSDPHLPVAQVCEFALEVLEALNYLHVRRGLLYCDLSADNVIHSPDGVKLIDLGAVRRIDDRDSVVWGKPGFQDPAIRKNGPSVATDLYTVGRMMAVLSVPFPGFRDDAPIPDPEDAPLLAEYPSFAKLLHRATNRDPSRRFASAAEMADQLGGVLREICAWQQDEPFPRKSTFFEEELRVVGVDPDAFPTVTPDLAAAALALPDPLAARADPALETQLRTIRARIEMGDAAVDDDIDELGRQQPGDWRVDWYRGLTSLIDGEVVAARQSFTAVLDALPGEAAPKLALARCAAHENDAALAERYYATVWRTDRSYVSAAFGLAWARHARRDLAGTVTALESVPETSRYAAIARVCAIQVRARECTAGQSPGADFFAAAERLTTLDLDKRRRCQVVAEVLEAVLGWKGAGRPGPGGVAILDPPDTLLGRPLTERGLRDGLETTYRELAKLAPTAMERITFVDKANECRNRSWI